MIHATQFDIYSILQFTIGSYLGSIFFSHGVIPSQLGTVATVWPVLLAPDDR
jgi:hypothetical protein